MDRNLINTSSHYSRDNKLNLTLSHNNFPFSIIHRSIGFGVRVVGVDGQHAATIRKRTDKGEGYMEKAVVFTLAQDNT